MQSTAFRLLQPSPRSMSSASSSSPSREISVSRAALRPRHLPFLFSLALKMTTLLTPLDQLAPASLGHRSFVHARRPAAQEAQAGHRRRNDHHLPRPLRASSSSSQLPLCVLRTRFSRLMFSQPLVYLISLALHRRSTREGRIRLEEEAILHGEDERVAGPRAAVGGRVAKPVAAPPAGGAEAA